MLMFAKYLKIWQILVNLTAGSRIQEERLTLNNLCVLHSF